VFKVGDKLKEKEKNQQSKDKSKEKKIKTIKTDVDKPTKNVKRTAMPKSKSRVAKSSRPKPSQSSGAKTNAKTRPLSKKTSPRVSAKQTAPKKSHKTERKIPNKRK
jgi:hypothetical protein